MIPDAYETLKADLQYSYRGVFTPDDVAEAVDAARALLEPRAPRRISLRLRRLGVAS